MGGINIIVSLVLAVVTVAGASVAWPRFTNQPRPAPLEQVNNVVKDTQLGKSFANVLGVNDGQSAQPMNVASEASKLTAGLLKSAQERAATIVVTQAVRQLLSQFDKLPAQEQKQIQELLCTPPTPTP